ncbi:MAG: zinc ribbon domain-containing protein [Gemmatimonadota bacterium]|nr:zinc ribbon domain-containing protein [Gemmatimonadota bacterium]
MTQVVLVACPQCQHRVHAEANFCPQCGATLRGPPCPSCGAPSQAGDIYCTQCGATLQPERARFGSPAARVPWAVAGMLALALVLTLVLRGGGGREITLSPPLGAPSGGQGSPTTPLGPTSAVDLGSMTPRDAATRLFDRVMRALEAGNQAEANQFLPMAIASYDLIVALSLDDRFHLSLLYAAAGNGDAALLTAEAGLAVRPTHILLLGAAAQAALAIGDTATARAHYQTLVDVYDEEIRADLEEYGVGAGGHANLLPALQAEAAAYLAGTG